MRRSSSSVFMPNHWNGVNAFGTKPPTLTVTEPQLYLELNGVHLESAIHAQPVAE